MALYKIYFIFAILLVFCRVGFSGVPYFSNYPFSYHQGNKAQEEGSIAKQEAKDQTHGIDILDFRHKKRDLLEELELIEAQKQIDKDRKRIQYPLTDLELIRLKRQDHPHPHVGDVHPENIKGELMESNPVEPVEIKVETTIYTPDAMAASPLPLSENDPTTGEPKHRHSLYSQGNVHRHFLKSSSSEEREQREKRIDRKIVPAVLPKSENNLLEPSQTSIEKRDLIAIGSDESIDSGNISTTINSIQIGQISAPSDSIGQPTELPGHKKHERKTK